jgi:hypothetical protein
MLRIRKNIRVAENYALDVRKREFSALISKVNSTQFLIDIGYSSSLLTGQAAITCFSDMQAHVRITL